MSKELEKQLEKTGTAEISNGVVTQVTQAIDETPSKVKMLVFGVMQEKSIIPIDQACAKCTFQYKNKAGTKACQSQQKKDAEARGFNNLICPQQFVD